MLQHRLHDACTALTCAVLLFTLVPFTIPSLCPQPGQANLINHQKADDCSALQNWFSSSTTTESIETLVRVTNEGQAHAGFLSTHCLILSTKRSAVVRLRNLVDREVLCVDSR